MRPRGRHKLLSTVCCFRPLRQRAHLIRSLTFQTQDTPGAHNGDYGALAASGTAAGLDGANKVTVYYRATGTTAVVHGSVQGNAWNDLSMTQVYHGGVWWHKLDLPVTATNGASPAPLLEFVLKDDNGNWAKSCAGENFKVFETGVYNVVNGALSKVEGRPVLVVSDLDDTMIGNDTATAAFKAFWEDDACLRGSMLAYNTGRALDKFLTLLEEKGWCMAAPDVLISSVGTKIYLHQDDQWVEDAAYAVRLGQGWNLEIVREAAYAALAAVGKDNMHFRPPEEQNNYKVTCGVKVDVLDVVVQQIQNTLANENVKAQLIWSGKGDWRFLDIISAQAGKLPALEYIRQKWNFSLDQTVACGDSGNDIDMLSGDNLAIVVGNAQPDLVKWVEGLPEQRKVRDGRKRLLTAAEYMANGILEGLQYFGFR